ncbi:MAG: response regulator transcription factor [Ramlibacter sp.]|nr:response regulator transcription factor [Ramlibacter sp.]MBX3658050.1 response regulator transcription factor [Ramlibacter sp.]MCW5648658.1 response regulator transcription factor [Ramlibacter sp.]
MPHRHSPITTFLADDSSLIRRRVAAMLREQGMEVLGEAETPQSSVDAILRLRPDVVVLDIQLRGGAGLQVLREVRRAAPGVVFVVLSNSSGPAYRKRYLSEGAAAFLDKTTEFDQLARSIDRAIQGSHHVCCHD